MRGEARGGIVVGGILAAAVAAALLLAGWLGDGAIRAPSRIGEVAVIDVTAAIRIQEADDDREIAVSGWFQHPVMLKCPIPIEPVVPLLNGDCGIDSTWLMRDPESLAHAEANTLMVSDPVGPAVHPVFDGPGVAWARPFDGQDAVPTPVVLIGHFDDPRAAGCVPNSRQTCLDRFVVTVVAWADGVDFP